MADKKSVAAAATGKPAAHMPYPWLFRNSPIAEKIKFALGCITLACFGPYVGLQVAACQTWEFLDVKTIGFIKLCSKFSEVVSPFCARFTRNKNDGFIIPLAIWLGVILPAWFFYELWRAVQPEYGFDWRRILVYNIVRIGPMVSLSLLSLPLRLST